MKIKLIITGILFFILSTIHAQKRYRVSYDFRTDSTGYLEYNEEKKGYVSIAKPKFKRNSLVEIKLVNVNPFAVEVEPVVTQSDVYKGGNAYNITSLFGNIGSLTKTPEDLKLNINPPDFKDEEIKKEDGTEVVSRSNVSILIENINTFNEFNRDIYLSKQTLTSSLINPNLRKGEIRSNLLNYLKIVKNDANLETEPYEDNFLPFIVDVKNKLRERSQGLIDDFDAIIEGYEEFAGNGKEGEEKMRSKSMDQVMAMSTIKADIEASENESEKNLDEILELLLLLESSSFEQTIDREVKKDRMNIQLKFRQSPFLDSLGYKRNNSAQIMRERDIKVFAKGGLKINTSIALTLNTFSDSKDYFIDTNTGEIGSDDNDFFTPNLATMINFYPFMGENFNIGGSFGLSIPITNDISGLNFLLGPSFFFGSENRLSFTGGISYGPIDQLRNGLEVGEEFNGNTSNLTRSVYDFGYFFGVSFSLFDVKN